MHFYEVWLPGLRGIFSWHSSEKIPIGARVKVPFRSQERAGIVVGISNQKPDFATRGILEVWDEHFISSKYIEIAREIAYENFCSLEKVLGLMIPNKFLFQKNPEKRETFFKLQNPGSKFGVRGEKQKKVIELLLQNDRVSETELRGVASLTTIKSLEAKKIIQRQIGKIIPARIPGKAVEKGHKLTSEQQRALDEILKDRKPALLFGITGSGKTEIYKKLAQRMLEEARDGQILFLLPEISLTPQLIAEFREIFGDKVAVWHSKLSEGEKIQEWARVASGDATILIGARSAALVPMKNPKLIILDEEHEWTFKNEFSPRIWTHDIAEKISQKFGTRLLFGSATPRLESFLKCEAGEWRRVDLLTRINKVELPEIEFVDLKNEARKGNFSPLSERLIEEIRDILQQKKQAVIFLNRRGFSGATFCKLCGQNFECPNCENNMKLHRKFDQQKFVCHVCGHLEKFPEKCPTCEAQDFEFHGWGTQMVEKLLAEAFPGIRLLRADSDSITGKHDFQRILEKFHNYEADILLGTQMIAKGLDFERVELVGVILADVGLSLPDFRAEERVFQILTQVSGRAGRRKTRGKIIIQTFRPHEEIFGFVRKHDTENFLHRQREHRERAGMPPFVNLAKITFSHRDKKVAFEEAKKFFKEISTPQKSIQRSETNSVFKSDFAPAFFPKTFSKYHFHVFLRTSKKSDLLDFLHKTKLPTIAKIDIGPSSLL